LEKIRSKLILDTEVVSPIKSLDMSKSAIIMDFNEFKKKMNTRSRELSEYYHRTLPVKAGAKVKSIVQENFRLGGFQGETLEKWPATKRQSGSGTDAKRGPLLSSRKVLYSGTDYRAGDAEVTIYNTVIYAGIHNDGGTTHPRVTPKMRRYAWARYYAAGGGRGGGKSRQKANENSDAEFWKGLALTKKECLSVRIPQRRFIGPSAKINKELRKVIERDLIHILTT